MLRLLRKRRVLLTYSLLVFLFYLWFSAYQSDQALDDLKQKARLLSQTAKPYDPICKIPELQIINHEKSQSEKKCRLSENWGDISSEHKWYFIPQIKRIINQIYCQYRSVIRVDDTKYLFGKWQALLKDGQLILDEVFEVVCKRVNSTSKRADFDNLYVQLVNKLNNKTKQTESTNNDSCKPLNIILLSYDSVSRSSWFKRVPKSTQYALDEMNFQLLNGYNIVGDGTPGLLSLFLFIILKNSFNFGSSIFESCSNTNLFR